MGTAFDLLLVAIILATVLINYFRGIFKMLKPFKFLAAFLIAIEYKSSVFVRAIIGKFINFDTFRVQLRDRLDSMWGEKLESTVSSGEAVDSGAFNWLANKITNITDHISEAVTSGVQDVTATVLDKAAAAAESFFVQLIGFIIVFIVAFLGITLIYVILTFVLKHGILKHINRILGGVAGLVFGFVIAWIAAILIVDVVPMLISVEPESASNGFFGIVKWFHNESALSSLFGVTKI